MERPAPVIITRINRCRVDPGLMEYAISTRRPLKGASWWTKTFCANSRSVSGRSTPGSDWGSREITKLRYLARASHSFTLKTRHWAEWIIRNVLQVTGLYWRARRNAERILVKRNDMTFRTLPPLFEGFTILHISDLHVDMNEVAMNRLIELVGGLQYDVCVLTGDYRGRTFGPFQPALDGIARLGAHLKQPIYAVLGNHDTIQMVPGLEAMGIRVLLNECETIVRKRPTDLSGGNRRCTFLQSG